MTSNDLPAGSSVLERIAVLEGTLRELRREAQSELGAPYALPGDRVRLLVVSIGGRRHGLLCAEEVVLLPRLLGLPGAPEDVLGLLDLRGEKIPVLDACRRLELPLDSLDLDTPLVVCGQGDDRYGVLVHRVETQIFVPPEAIAPPPAQTPCAPFVLGIVRHADENLLVLDPLSFFSLQARDYWLRFQLPGWNASQAGEAPLEAEE